MKGIVLGNGYIGNRFAEFLGYEIVKDRVTDTDSIKQILDEKQPDVIINAIGRTGSPNTDWCQSHQQETWEANVTIPQLMATQCKISGTYMVHMGSGCIYQGDNHDKGFNEEDPALDFGQYYSHTKVEAENYLKSFSNVLQIRIKMPVDSIINDRNLISKIVKYDKLIDIQNSMTVIPDLLLPLRILIEEKAQGIFNFTNPGTVSPYEIMQMYKEIVDPTHRVTKISGKELDGITKARRSNCVLDNGKLLKVINGKELIIRNVRDGIRDCLKQYKLNLGV